VGAGDTPCVILMVGTRSGPEVRYPMSELAAATVRASRRRHPLWSRRMRRPSGSAESGRRVGPACPGASCSGVRIRNGLKEPTSAVTV
jgi:hypothetical protein